MKQKKTVPQLYKLASSVLISWIFATTQQMSFAAPNQQSGEIELEVHKDVVSATDVQNQTLEYFQAFVSALDSGKIPTPAPLDVNKISYLNSLYLYCTINNGTCPLPLDAILELDIISSKQKNSEDCAFLTQFWTQWLKNGFEKRQEYNIKTAFIGITNEFTNVQRPKYIKCKELVSNTLHEGAGNENWLKDRYSGQGAGKEHLAKLLEFIILIKDKGINVFSYAAGKQKK